MKRENIILESNSIMTANTSHELVAPICILYYMYIYRFYTKITSRYALPI